MMKKLVAFLCATLMVMSLVACGSKEASNEVVENVEVSENEEVEEVAEEKEPVTISFWYRNAVGEQQYTQDVEDKLNEILASTEGYEYITIDLVPCGREYATDIALAQTSGVQLDVVSTAMLDVVTEINNGSFIPLDDLIANNPEITSDLPEWFVDYGKVNGEMYYIPNYQQCANQFFWFTPTEFLENSGYTYDEVQEILLSKDVDKVAEFYENYITAIREYTGSESIYLCSDKVSNVRYWEQPSNSIYEVDWFGRFYWDEANDKINFTDLNEDIQAGYIKNGELYENGILYKNAETDTEFCLDANLLSDQSYAFNFCQSYGTTDMVAESYSASLGFDVSVFEVHDYVFISNTNAAGGVAISATCEHPEEAAKVLALLFNSKYEEFYNTLCWGLEGTHYEKNADGTIKTLEFDGSQGGADATYCYHKWTGGNTFNAWLNQSMTAEQEDFIINEINESDNTVITPLMGFVLDTKPVANELAQITTIVKEHQQALRAGLKGNDTEAYLAEYLNKLETAGLSKVLDEFNAQADAYLGR